ncbi:phosphodiesterase [Sulfurifustis variabilis]|uniref:Phosphoesterase n=1 Tax=Sulfurifustis variabilis TaxID=1675686 RepID=A0A1B4VC97_9GAMM|nr:metallophosphoesterase family protein [Sulfurifustis variabilis]BAU48951.1 phosphodiesterase [Sulfurifustis variabilis]
MQRTGGAGARPSTQSQEAGPQVALLADTHGYLDPRIADVVRECDLAVHAGDIGGAPVIRAMRPRAGRVVAVRGNNDSPRSWGADGRAALSALPEEAHLDLPGGRIVVVHGDRVTPAARRHERLRRLYGDARAVVYGHSHRLVCDCETLPWVLNPGAAGRARTFGGPSCLVLDARRDSWRVRVLRFPP